MSWDYKKICQDILSVLSPRQKEVIERRFGLVGGERETLQKIGRDFDITRERVRQIEREGLAKIRKNAGQPELKKFFSYLSRYIKKDGGAKREDMIIKSIGRDEDKNSIRLLLAACSPFHYSPDDDDVYAFWSFDASTAQKTKDIISQAVQYFEAKKEPVTKEQILSSLCATDSLLFNSSLEIAKRIERNPLGYFGLTSWPEIKPRGVKDGAYLVLRKEQTPLHFRQIAEMSSKLGSNLFRNKKVLPQTVHNELIRDERFILVGRGIYALKEWGYYPGTVKEVILAVFNEKKVPLSKEEILQAVEKQRIVKPNTVFLNLADKKYFLRNDEGRYILKTA